MRLGLCAEAVVDVAMKYLDLEVYERFAQFWLPVSPLGGMESEMDG